MPNCAPVADVVGADHFMAQKLLGTCRGVADDGGAQVADVHLFRHVRRGVVDYDSLRLNRCDAQFRCVQHPIGLARDPVAVQENVDKAGAGDFHFSGDVAEIQQLHHFFRQLTGRHAQLFGDGHHAIGLVITKLRLGGWADLRFAIGWRASGDQRLADFI